MERGCYTIFKQKNRIIALILNNSKREKSFQLPGQHFGTDGDSGGGGPIEAEFTFIPKNKQNKFRIKNQKLL